MATENGPEEIEQQYIDSMGTELGKLFFCLWNECAALHWVWREFVILYGTSPERVNLLNRTAGAFFRVVQDSLWEGVLLHICRLTDPPMSAGKGNLTIQRLPGLVDPAIRDRVLDLVKHCLIRSEFARDWRKRRIAHRDLRLAMNDKSATPLALASRRTANEALASIAAVLNAVDSHYRDTTVAYGMVSTLGNAESLLHTLQAGLKAHREREKRFESGTYTQEDVDEQPV